MAASRLGVPHPHRRHGRHLEPHANRRGHRRVSEASAPACSNSMATTTWAWPPPTASPPLQAGAEAVVGHRQRPGRTRRQCRARTGRDGRTPLPRLWSVASQATRFRRSVNWWRAPQNGPFHPRSQSPAKPSFSTSRASTATPCSRIAGASSRSPPASWGGGNRAGHRPSLRHGERAAASGAAWCRRSAHGRPEDSPPVGAQQGRRFSP